MLGEIVTRDVWETLPLGLRASHSAPGRAEGRVQVTVRYGWLGAWLAACLGLPRRGCGVRVHLAMTETPEGVLWERSFDGRPLATLNRLRDGQLTEIAGQTEIDYDLSVRQDRIEYVSRAVRLRGRDLPRPVRPKITSLLTPTATGWYVRVRFALPLLGVLCQYEGEMSPS